MQPTDCLLKRFLATCLLGLVAYCCQARQVHADSVPLRQALQQVENRFRIRLIYVDSMVAGRKGLPERESQTPEEALQRLLSPYRLEAIRIHAAQFVIEAPAVVPGAVQIEHLLLTGEVRSAGTRLPLQQVTISLQKGSRFTTGPGGRFTLEAVPDAVLTFSFVGYAPAVFPATRLPAIVYLQPLVVAIPEVVVGSRIHTIPALGGSTLPVDVITRQELQAAGKTAIGDMMHYRTASLNSVGFGINNFASYINPVTLRGLAPDQMLVLVNGKRFHNSSGLNLNNTVGKGAAGTDLNILPIPAIRSIEVLRDGASAQYGSDAIAGIINLNLQRSDSAGSAGWHIGKTAAGDGAVAQVWANAGFPLLQNKGFLNISFSGMLQQPTNRSGSYTGLVYRQPDDASALDPVLFPTPAARAAENRRLDDLLVQARQFNRRAIVYGQSRLRSASCWYNSNLPLGGSWSVYSFGGLSVKKEQAYGFYRYPSDARNATPRYPDGYAPVFPATVADVFWVAGLRRSRPLGWNMDLSMQYGGNSLVEYADHTINASLPDHSPTRFFCGKTLASQTIGSASFSRRFDRLLPFRFFGLALGADALLNHYRITPGEYLSYADGNNPGTPGAQLRPAGANGRTGFSPADAIAAYRTNLGLFADMEAGLGENVILASSLRYERYSDFGGNLSGKVSGRINTGRAGWLRVSVSLGFRAPSLQQVFYRRQQFQFFQKNGQADVFQVLHLRNNDLITRALKIPTLRPETARNLSAGYTWSKNRLRLSADVYLILISSRIVVSGRLDSTVAVVKPLLQGQSISDIQFFTNAVNTRTSGLDLTAEYRIRFTDQQQLNFGAGVSFNHTIVPGGMAGIRVPAGSLVPPSRLVDRVTLGLLETATPGSKYLFSIGYVFKQWQVTSRVSRFGTITYQDNDPELDQSFSPKWITDLQAGWNFRKRYTLSAGVDNLLNVYPDRLQEVPDRNTNITFSGQIPYSRNVSQFGFNGMYYYLNAIVRF